MIMAENPGLLYVAATLIPLASFFLLLLAGGIRAVVRPYRDSPFGGLAYRLFGGDQPGRIPAYVATNLLDSMVSHARPFRAEINDMVNTLLDGANGLVLAAETAIGKYPVQCVRMVRRLIQQHERKTWRATAYGSGRRVRQVVG